MLISADRAEALIDATKADFTMAIHRTAPMATRVVPTKGTDFGDKTVRHATLAQASDSFIRNREETDELLHHVLRNP